MVIAHGPNRMVLKRWGLIPYWAKDQKATYRMINARIETHTQRRSYRGLLAHNRCLVPASGYYEWTAEGSGKTKIPDDIHPSKGASVAFAGFYDTWTSAKGEELQTFTIVTRDADELMARLHQRMPVVLAREDEQGWADPDVTAPIQAMEILARSAGVHLDAYPVSRMVNKSSAEGELLRQRATYMSSTIAAPSPRSIATSAGHGRRPAGVSRHMVLL